MSTFHGLEMAKQALFTQQSALYTTGHNISNANTDGYSRQRVNFEAQTPYPSASRNRLQIPGQMGTGVQAGSVERIRNQFLDYQFRTENSKSGFWSAKSDALSRMERIMNEPTDSGLSKTMNQFWESLQDLAVNPGNRGEKAVVAQRGLALADTFNYASSSLQAIRSDLKKELDITTDRANSLLTQMKEINEQLRRIEQHGYAANDLYDERDRLIDELSGIMNIKVSYDSSGEGAPSAAQGIVTIELADQNGKAVKDAVLLDGKTGKINELSIKYSGGEMEAVSSIVIGGGQPVEIPAFHSDGSLKGIIESYGYTAGERTVKGDYPDMLDDLDKMVHAFAEAFNELHRDPPFFKIAESAKGAASSVTVNEEILDNPNLIQSSKAGNDGALASELAALFDKDSLIGDASIRKYYESVIGKLGVKAQKANRMTNNANVLKNQVENQRLSVSAVSLDEEMTNMIKFQHAYNAAARSMTATDELLDRIINGMGLVGR
jgi:flagellar hook-associated protein 1 FlgK